MPINALIPLAGTDKQPSLMQPQDFMNLQGSMQKNTIQEMAIEQDRALKNVLSSPTNYDEKGQLNELGLRGIAMAGKPDVAAQLYQRRQLAEQERTKALENAAQTHLLQSKVSASQAQALADANFGLRSAYDVAKKQFLESDPNRDESAAAAAAQRLIREKYLPPVRQQLIKDMPQGMQIGADWTPENADIAIAAGRTVAEALKQQAELRKAHAEREKQPYYTGPNGLTYRVSETGTTPYEVFAEGKWSPWSGTTTDFKRIGATPLVGNLVQDEAGNYNRVQGTTVTPVVTPTGEPMKGPKAPGAYGVAYEEMPKPLQDTVDFYAAQQLGGDNSWRVGLSRSKGGSDLIRAVDERVPQRAAELGLTPADIGTNKAVRVASQAALTQNTKDIAVLKPYVAMLDQNADVLARLADKAIATNSALANKPLNWIRTNAADNPDVAEYLAQIEIVKNEATRVISNPRLVGQMTDTARHEIESIINGTMPINATKRVLERIKNDGQRRISTMETQQDELQGKIKKMFPGNTETAPSKVIKWDELK